MNYGWIDLLTLVGSVGLFLYGMKLMSEGLQKIAGDSLRKVLAAMTSNRFAGLLTGILVTVLVQSSSATTVMVVSFVNAGLITLEQSMAVIFGANVGTTLTAWIIALFGFKFNIAALVIPLIAFSIPFFNSTSNKRRSWGEFIVGFALLFLGLDSLNHSVPDLKANPEIFAVLQQYSEMGFLSALFFALIGMILTMVVQASSATFAIALIMVGREWIPFELACAMVIGAHIGTCITPVLAALSANTMAKRAAMGHLLFNVFGSIWALALFYPFCDLVKIVTEWTFGSFTADMGVAMFHTLMATINLMVMIWLTGAFVKLVSKIMPEKKSQDEAFTLKFITKGGIAATGELSILPAKKEVSNYAEETYKMFGHIHSMMAEPLGSERQLELFEKVKGLENKSDEAEMEIAGFLNQVSGKGLSQEGELEAHRLFKIVDELESIADSIYHIAITLKAKSDQRVLLNQSQNIDLTKMMSLTDAALVHMLKVVSNDDRSQRSLDIAYNNEDEINNFRSQIRNSIFEERTLDDQNYQQRTYYMDMISECEKVGDYIVNVINAIHDK